MTDLEKKTIEELKEIIKENEIIIESLKKASKMLIEELGKLKRFAEARRAKFVLPKHWVHEG